MRSFSEAKTHWCQLDDFHSLTDLKIHVSSHKEPQITAGLRSVCWKVFLVFKTLDRSSWPKHLSHSRKTYESLRTQYLRAIRHPDEFESSVDPLSEIEESPWVALRADEDLRAEIFQDIERCMPDNVYFRQPATQDMMLEILFVWCKMHPGIGYRQAKSFYAPAETGSLTRDTLMLARSSKIFENYLPKVDPQLFAHLTKLEIVPQIFLLRWIRLLFGREFPLDSVFDMWDALFAIDSSLELVDMISIAMLLRIRWELVAADTNEVFSLLLRYPEPATPAYTFIKDALYLRDHLTPQGGAAIISRYGKSAPSIELETSPIVRESSPSPSFASSRTRNRIGSPKSFVSQQSAGIEALLQGAAKNVLERGSQWGVGKVFRDAVGEVRKNVESYQVGASSGQTTPRSGGREFRKPAQIATSIRPSIERVYSGNFIRKMEEADKRNQDLAKMLEVAVGDLWEYHREQTEEQKAKEDNERAKSAMEGLSLAIAKVQFVQVYLQDSSLPLTADESAEQAATAKAGQNSASSRPLSPEPIAHGPSLSVVATSRAEQLASTDAKKTAPTSSRSTPPSTPGLPPSTQSLGNLSPRSRPQLTSSNFSWMLGEDSASSSFASGTAHSTFSSDEKRRLKGKGFLFGDEDDDESSGKEANKGNASSSRGGTKGGRSSKGRHAPAMEMDEEVIDLDNMGRGSVM